MQISIWLLCLDALLWASVFLLHAVEFRVAPLSPFELKRRAETGDIEAVRLNEREQTLPRLKTLRYLIASLLAVAAIALTIISLQWAIGLIVATALFLVVETVARQRVVRTAAEYIYAPQEPRMLDTVRTWNWLDWFQGFHENGGETSAASKAELHYIVERSAGVLTRDELTRLQASLGFDAHTVEDIMTPISVVDVANVRDSLGPLVLDDLFKTGHSRFPVIDGDVHHVVGILYLHDIINLKSAKPTVKEAMDPRVHYIHQNQTLEHALNGFLKSHRHLFVVVNDYRETVGVLSLEDVLETLLGKKIVDEFDQYEDLRAVAESNPRKNNLPKGKTDI